MSVELSTLLASVEDAIDDTDALRAQLGRLRDEIIVAMQRPTILEASFRAVMSINRAQLSMSDEFDTDEPTREDVRQLDEYREGQYVFPLERAE